MFLGIKRVLLFQSRDCAQLGPPPQGEVVQVRWTDGLVYGAKFVAAHAVHMYLVGQSIIVRAFVLLCSFNLNDLSECSSASVPLQVTEGETIL